MKKTYITIIVLIVLVAGVAFVFGTSKKAEAPVPEALVKTQTEIPATLPPAEVKEFTITGKNFSFTPPTIAVKKGDRVKITFKNENGFHDFVIDEYGVAAKQAQSPKTEVLEFTADKIGSFEYYCSVGTHRAMGMKGTLEVIK